MIIYHHQIESKSSSTFIIIQIELRFAASIREALRLSQVLAAWLLVAMALHWARAKELQAGQAWDAPGARAGAGWDGTMKQLKLRSEQFQIIWTNIEVKIMIMIMIYNWYNMLQNDVFWPSDDQRIGADYCKSSVGVWHVDPHDLAPKCLDRRISEVWDVEVSVFSKGHCKFETSIVSHFSKQFLRPLKSNLDSSIFPWICSLLVMLLQKPLYPLVI